MKVFRMFLALGLVGVLTFPSMAQGLSKDEKKKLKKEIKVYKKDPTSYRDMKARNKRNIVERDETIEALTSQLDEANARYLALKDSLDALQRRYNALMLKHQNIGAVPEGVVYAVQVGYYKELDLQAFNQTARFIKAEEIDGAKRYVIGYFTELTGAVQFGEDVKKIGIKDAFVSQYVDGKRNMTFDVLKVK